MFSETYDEASASRAVERITEQVERALTGDPIQWCEVVDVLPVGEELKLADWAQRKLDALPVPISAAAGDPDDPVTRRRRVLARFRAEIYARQGDPEPLIEHLRTELLCYGANAERLLLLLLQDVGREMEAWVMTKLALGLNVGDKDKVLAIQGRLAAVPEGWTESVRQLAEDPTPEAWRALMSFVPLDKSFFAIQHTIYLLVDLGADPDAIFRSAVQDGATSALLELVDTGLVNPDVVVAHAEHAAQPAFWIALAARGAFERGDYDRCVALASRAVRMPDRDAVTAVQLHALWGRVDDNLRPLLDSAGVREAVSDLLGRDAR